MASFPVSSLQGASFGTAISRFWNRYATFSGRASRSEYWWAALFNILVAVVLGVLDGVIFGLGEGDPEVLGSIYGLATLIPNLAVSIRRLHDIGRTGWWVLLWIVPVIGWIVLLIFHVTKSEAGPNRFGDTGLAVR